MTPALPFSRHGGRSVLVGGEEKRLPGLHDGLHDPLADPFHAIWAAMLEAVLAAVPHPTAGGAVGTSGSGAVPFRPAFFDVAAPSQDEGAATEHPMPPAEAPAASGTPSAGPGAQDAEPAAEVAVPATAEEPSPRPAAEETSTTARPDRPSPPAVDGPAGARPAEPPQPLPMPPPPEAAPPHQPPPAATMLQPPPPPARTGKDTPPAGPSAAEAYPVTEGAIAVPPADSPAPPTPPDAPDLAILLDGMASAATGLAALQEALLTLPLPPEGAGLPFALPSLPLLPDLVLG